MVNANDITASPITIICVKVENYKTVSAFVFTLTRNLEIRGNKNGQRWRTCRGEGIGLQEADDKTVELILLGSETYRKYVEASVLAFLQMLALGYVMQRQI